MKGWMPGVIGAAAALALVVAAFGQEQEIEAPGQEAPAEEGALGAPTLFIALLDPEDDDVEVALEVESLTLIGRTLPGVVLSVDGELVEVDEEGGFMAEVALEEGANAIEIVASDDQGNVAETTVYVVRGG